MMVPSGIDIRHTAWRWSEEMPPLVANRGSGAGELTVRLDVHVAVFVRSRRIRHFVPTTGGPLPRRRNHTRPPTDDTPAAITVGHISTSANQSRRWTLTTAAAHAEVGSVCPCAQECPRPAG